MAGGLTLQVRQIGSYPLVGITGPNDLVLIQPGGLGNPYATITASDLVAHALQNGTGPFTCDAVAPAGADPGQIFIGNTVYPDPGATTLYNLYLDLAGNPIYLGNGVGAIQAYSGGQFAWQLTPAGEAGFAVSPGALFNTMVLSQTGMLSLPLGTLSVARDPAAALEVATMGWVGRNTATSFNGRQGAITLNGCDIYSALCLSSTIATEDWVNANIQASIQMVLANHPFVFGWNGRTGAVYLTLADISCVFMQPGQQPITQTPPLTSNDYSIPNTAWVVEYITNEFAGTGTTIATQSWVLANTVNSFNGRQGPVTLTSADVYDVGAAPLNSPAFSGIPTAPTAAVGQATGQIATTAFVQQAITNNTAGVSTFNTRTGDVVLTAGDVTAAGGLTNPSAALTGVPTCPTQPPGTNLPVIANCEFVQAAIAAGTVTSFNTRTGAVTLTLADITGVGGAPLVSPAFSSVPTAPTAAPGTNTVQLATCAFVQAALTAAGGVSSFNSRTGAVTLTANDVSAVGALVNPSVGLTGSPTATTATAGDNSQRIATTAFVTTALASGAVSSFNTRTGAVTLQGADITAAGGALLASPAFTGAPTAPTAAAGTNNTQIATTAYVTAAILADTTGVTSFNTRTGAITLILADITGAGGAPIASPSFTGVPLGPTATAGTSTTQLATTAFVQNAIASSGVSSFNARTGAVTLIANDISAAGGALLAGPIFTGVPAAPTAAPGANTTQLATTAFVTAAITAQGGPFLPLTGGTITSGQINFVPPVSGAGTSAVTWNLSSAGANWAYTQTGTGAVLYNTASNFGVAVYPSGTAGATVTGGGLFNFASNGTLTAYNVDATGALTSGGQASVNSLVVTNNAVIQGAFTASVNATVSGTLTAQNVTALGYLTADANTYPSGAANGYFTNPPAGGWRLQNNSGAYVFQNNPLVDPIFFFYGGAGYLCQIYTTGAMTILGTLTQGSDGTRKTNMSPVTAGISLVKQLLPKRFAWKTEPDEMYWGFVAQDVEPVIPEAVKEHPAAEDGSVTLGLDVTAIVAVLVNALKQMDLRCQALEEAAGITPPAEVLA